jgi:hypothetical protein
MAYDVQSAHSFISLYRVFLDITSTLFLKTPPQINDGAYANDVCFDVRFLNVPEHTGSCLETIYITFAQIMCNLFTLPSYRSEFDRSVN